MLTTSNLRRGTNHRTVELSGIRPVCTYLTSPPP